MVIHNTTGMITAGMTATTMTATRAMMIATDATMTTIVTVTTTTTITPVGAAVPLHARTTTDLTTGQTLEGKTLLSDEFIKINYVGS